MKRIGTLCLIWNVFMSSAFASPYGSSLAGSQIGQHWEAVNTSGEIQSLADMKGKVSIYFFGFTQCPDVCPTTMGKLLELWTMLSPTEQEQLRIVFVSVDPERDTPNHLKAYLSNFSDRFEGLTGSPAQIKGLAKSFRVNYRRVPLGDSYTMEHSANLFLFDKLGQARLFYYGDVPAEHLRKDIIDLLAP